MKQGDIIGNSWSIKAKLGSGAFGDVFSVQSSLSNDKAVYAMKTASINPKKNRKGIMIDSKEALRLNHEYNLYRTVLKDHPSILNLPRVKKFYGDHNGTRYLILPCLDHTLETQMKMMKGGSLSVEDTLLIGYQIVHVMQHIHKHIV
jgi:serine/threonine protein kinase